jgi:hypothetical protein
VANVKLYATAACSTMLIFMSNFAASKSTLKSAVGGVRRLPEDDYTRDLPHLAGEYLGRNIGSNRRAACGPLEASLQPSSTKTVGPLLVYLHPPILFLGGP